MRDRIRQAIANVWNVSPDEIPDDANSDSLPGWDSLRHLELILELEMSFGVQIPADEVAELFSISAIDETLRAHGVV